MTALAALLVRWRQSAFGASGADLVTLQTGWDRIAGGLHSADSGVSALRSGQLVVVATSEVAARELAMLSDHLLSAANLLLGRDVVRRVSVRVGELPARVVDERLPSPPPPRPLLPEERAACRRTAAVIADEDLRSVFEGWMERHLASGRAGDDDERDDTAPR